MAPGLPRTHLSSSTLIRLLHDHAGADGAESKQTFAERLSQWLGWTDAIALSAVLNGSGNAPVPSTVATGRFMPARGVLAEFDRVRDELAHAIHADHVLAPQPPAPARPKSARPKRPSAQPAVADAPAAPPEDPTDFAPCRRQLSTHQRTMTERISTLRADVRLALTNQSAALGQLAAVDAVMDDALAAREKHVLSLVPALLERRFEKLRDANRPGAGADAAPGAQAGADAVAPAGLEALAGAEALAPAPAAAGSAAAMTATTPTMANEAHASAPAMPPTPPAWRIACGREMQDVLLAELDLRLQPVHGMIEALDHALGHDLTRQ
jgi:hypothetical protein